MAHELTLRGSYSDLIVGIAESVAQRQSDPNGKHVFMIVVLVLFFH